MIKTKLNSITIIAGIIGLVVSTNISVQANTPENQFEFHFPSSQITTNTQIIAQGYDRPDDDLEGEGKGKIWRKLNLSTEQQKEMRGIRQKYKPQMSSLREQIQSEREKLDTMMKAEESETTLRNQHQKIVQIDQQIHNLRFESMLEMRSVLSSEQRQEFQEMMNERRASHQRRKP